MAATAGGAKLKSEAILSLIEDRVKKVWQPSFQGDVYPYPPRYAPYRRREPNWSKKLRQVSF